jgi:hypothetical protein
MLGEILMDALVGNSESFKINVSALPKGIYVMKYGNESVSFIKL